MSIDSLANSSKNTEGVISKLIEKLHINSKIMKKLIYIVPIAFTLMLYISCGGNETVTPTTKSNCVECPTITSVSPSIGFAGDSVKIVGAKFKGLKAVYFGVKEVNSFNLSSSGDTITVEVPQAETGKEKDSVVVSVLISDPNKTGNTINSNVKGSFKYGDIVIEDLKSKITTPFLGWISDVAVDKSGNLYFLVYDTKAYIQKVDAQTYQVTTVYSDANLSGGKQIRGIAIDQLTNKLYITVTYTSTVNNASQVFSILSTNISTPFAFTTFYSSKIDEAFANNFSINGGSLYIAITNGFGSTALLIDGNKTSFLFGSYTDDFKIVNNDLVALQFGQNIFKINLFKDFKKTNPSSEIITQDNTPALNQMRSTKLAFLNNNLVYILKSKLYIHDLNTKKINAIDLATKIPYNSNVIIRSGINNELIIVASSILKLTIR